MNMEKDYGKPKCLSSRPVIYSSRHPSGLSLPTPMVAMKAAKVLGVILPI